MVVTILGNVNKITIILCAGSSSLTQLQDSLPTHFKLGSVWVPGHRPTMQRVSGSKKLWVFVPPLKASRIYRQRQVGRKEGGAEEKSCFHLQWRSSTQLHNQPRLNWKEQINLHLSLCLSCIWAPTREVIWEASKRLNQIQIQVFLSSSAVPCHKNMRCQELQGSNWGEVPQQEKTSLEKLWHLIVPPPECRALHFIPNAA